MVCSILINFNSGSDKDDTDYVSSWHGKADNKVHGGNMRSTWGQAIIWTDQS